MTPLAMLDTLAAWAARRHRARRATRFDQHADRALEVANDERGNDRDDHDERDLHAKTWTQHDDRIYRKLTRWKRDEKK